MHVLHTHTHPMIYAWLDFCSTSFSSFAASRFFQTHSILMSYEIRRHLQPRIEPISPSYHPRTHTHSLSLIHTVKTDIVHIRFIHAFNAACHSNKCSSGCRRHTRRSRSPFAMSSNQISASLGQIHTQTHTHTHRSPRFLIETHSDYNSCEAYERRHRFSLSRIPFSLLLLRLSPFAFVSFSDFLTFCVCVCALLPVPLSDRLCL